MNSESIIIKDYISVNKSPNIYYIILYKICNTTKIISFVLVVFDSNLLFYYLLLEVAVYFNSPAAGGRWGRGTKFSLLQLLGRGTNCSI